MQHCIYVSMQGMQLNQVAGQQIGQPLQPCPVCYHPTQLDGLSLKYHLTFKLGKLVGRRGTGKQQTRRRRRRFIILMAIKPSNSKETRSISIGSDLGLITRKLQSRQSDTNKIVIKIDKVLPCRKILQPKTFHSIDTISASV